MPKIILKSLLGGYFLQSFVMSHGSSVTIMLVILPCVMLPSTRVSYATGYLLSRQLMPCCPVHVQLHCILCQTITSCLSTPNCRAAHEKWGDSIREYQCVDVSQDMNNLAEYLLRGTF